MGKRILFLIYEVQIPPPPTPLRQYFNPFNWEYGVQLDNIFGLEQMTSQFWDPNHVPPA